MSFQELSNYIAPGVLFLWGLVIMPLSILLAARFGLVDLPSDRKVHQTPMPRGGGIALWSGIMFWGLIFSLPSDPLVPLALTGSTIVFFAGYLDDMAALSPFPRLAAHFGAAALGLWSLGNSGLQTTWLGYLVGVFWVAGSVNAYNFIDGLNGLSLGMSIVTCLVMGILGFGYWAFPLALLCLGALPWNFPKAKTFMGDGGVYLLGYLIGLLQVSSTLNWLRALWAIPVLLLLGGVPVIDTLVAITRRLLRRQSPFYPDRGHLHHKLLDRGFSPVKTWIVMIGLQLLSLIAASIVFLTIH